MNRLWDKEEADDFLGSVEWQFNFALQGSDDV